MDINSTLYLHLGDPRQSQCRTFVKLTGEVFGPLFTQNYAAVVTCFVVYYACRDHHYSLRILHIEHTQH